MDIQKTVRHESPTSKDHKALKIVLDLIKGKADYGIKKGELILYSGIPFAQWHFMQDVVQDHPNVEYQKGTRMFYWRK